VMAVRMEGEFTSDFQLNEYPFDVQGMTIVLNMNCRLSGPMPIEITVDDSCTATMTCISLCPPSKEWSVMPEMYIRPHTVGTGLRSFPGIEFTAKCVRQPFYHLVYLAAPFGIFNLIAVLTCSTRRLADASHRAQLSLMLVLTVSTYRIAIGNKLPPINYLTTMDHYSLVNVSITLAIALQSRIQILLSENGLAQPAGSTMTGTFDVVCIVMFACAWLFTHVFYGFICYSRLIQPRVRDNALNHPDAQVVTDDAYKSKISADGRPEQPPPSSSSAQQSNFEKMGEHRTVANFFRGSSTGFGALKEDRTYSA